MLAQFANCANVSNCAQQAYSRLGLYYLNTAYQGKEGPEQDSKRLQATLLPI